MISNQHQITSTLKNSLRIGRSQNYRVLLVLTGQANLCVKSVCDAFLETITDQTIGPQKLAPKMLQSVSTSTNYIMHVPDPHSNSDVSDEINALLGGEHVCLIFDARNTFDERLFAAAAGTITAGGLLVLQTPPLHEWASRPFSWSTSDQPSLFISRLCKKLVAHHTVKIDTTPPTKKQNTPPNKISQDSALFIAAAACKTKEESQCDDWKIEQDAMLELLLTNLQSNPESVSVVQGDRGRGKSTLIGRAINQLIASESSKHRSISITANRRSACEILLKSAQQPIRFVQIDKAVSISHDVLIVEEAGSIPITVLEQLLQKSRSTIFATTVQGYEGAGRGFAIRFTRRLNKLRPDWLKLNPVLPIRWSKGDPLESFVNDALLLTTELSTIQQSTRLTPENAHVILVDKHTLADDDLLLAQVYGLLVQAHYQTTPADLRNLLDQSHLLLFVQKTDQVLTGAALVALEGEIPSDLHQLILHKKRRLADQILPQLLAQSSGEADALNERFARIVRIAIHPAIHQQGFGTHLFNQLHEQLTTDAIKHVQVTGIGASFGADENTLSFWLKQGLKPIHYGYKINPRSALRAACLISSQHSPVKESIDKACWLLHVNIQARISQITDTDSIEKKLLAATKSANETSLSSHDIERLIHDFCQARRSFIDTVGLLLTSDFLNETNAVHDAVRHTLANYQYLSPKSRKSAEKQLRSVLLNTGAIIDHN